MLTARRLIAVLAVGLCLWSAPAQADFIVSGSQITIGPSPLPQVVTVDVFIQNVSGVTQNVAGWNMGFLMQPPASGAAFSGAQVTTTEPPLFNPASGNFSDFFNDDILFASDFLSGAGASTPVAPLEIRGLFSFDVTIDADVEGLFTMLFDTINPGAVAILGSGGQELPIVDLIAPTINVVPEPASLLLAATAGSLGLGYAGVRRLRRRRQLAKA